MKLFSLGTTFAAALIPMGLCAPPLIGQVRVPPGIGCGTTKTWVQPTGIISSVPRWFMHITSNPFYIAEFCDYQESYIPLKADDSLILDVASFFNRTLGTTAPLAFIAATDHRLSSDPNSYLYQVNNAPFINNTLVIVGQGIDADGQWLAIYETPVVFEGISGGLDIFSQSQGGPQPSTVNAIKNALLQLNCAPLSTFVNQLGNMCLDGRRNGQPPFQCNEACQNNQPA